MRQKTASILAISGRFGAGTVATLLLPGVVSAAPVAAEATRIPDATATAILLTGLMLLVLEIKIISNGLLGLLGTACVVAATIIIWRDDASFWGIPVIYVIPVILLTLILAVILAVLSAQAYKERVVSGAEGFAGDVAEASENLDPTGRVFYQGSYWQAHSSAPVRAGSMVRITRLEKLTLFVEPLPAETLPSAAQAFPQSHPTPPPMV